MSGDIDGDDRARNDNVSRLATVQQAARELRATLAPHGALALACPIATLAARARSPAGADSGWRIASIPSRSVNTFDATSPISLPLPVFRSRAVDRAGRLARSHPVRWTGPGCRCRTPVDGPQDGSRLGPRPTAWSMPYLRPSATALPGTKPSPLPGSAHSRSRSVRRDRVAIPARASASPSPPRRYRRSRRRRPCAAS